MKAKMKVLLLAFVFFTFFIPYSWAEVTETHEITLKDSINNAVVNSDAVKKAEKEIIKDKAYRDQKSDAVDYSPISTHDTTLLDVNWAQYLTTDYTWQISKKNLTAEQDTVVMNTCNMYWQILLDQDAVKNADQQLKKAEIDNKNAQIMALAGVSSSINYSPAEMNLVAKSKLEEAKSNLEKSKNTLNSDFVAFNQTQGLSPADRPILVDRISYKSVGEVDIDFVVTKVLEQAPQMWIASKNVEIQEQLKNLMFYTGQQKPYDARKSDVEQSKIEVSNTKKNLELLTRSLYNNILTLEEQHSTAEEAINLAKESLRKAEIKMKCGLATKADVENAKTSLTEAEFNLMNLEKNHEYYKLALTKPWAYSSK